jgi:hypothetical protein
MERWRTLLRPKHCPHPFVSRNGQPLLRYSATPLLVIWEALFDPSGIEKPSRAEHSHRITKRYAPTKLLTKRLEHELRAVPALQRSNTPPLFHRVRQDRFKEFVLVI